MPAKRLNGFVESLAPLMAEESLQLLNAVAYGTPSAMKPEVRRAYVDQLAMTANHGTTPRVAAKRLESPEALQAKLGALGIPVEITSRGGAS